MWISCYVGSKRRVSCVWLRTLRGRFLFALCNLCVGLGRSFSNIALIMMPVCFEGFILMGGRNQIVSWSCLRLISLVSAVFLLRVMVSLQCHLYQKRIVVHNREDTFGNDFLAWNLLMYMWMEGRINQQFISIICYVRLLDRLLFYILLCKVWRDWVIGHQFVVFWFVWFL